MNRACPCCPSGDVGASNALAVAVGAGSSDEHASVGGFDEALAESDYTRESKFT